jgi:hypothetical protein
MDRCEGGNFKTDADGRINGEGKQPLPPEGNARAKEPWGDFIDSRAPLKIVKGGHLSSMN